MLHDSTLMGLRMEVAFVGDKNGPMGMRGNSREEAQQNLRTRCQSDENKASGIGQPGVLGPLLTLRS